MKIKDVVKMPELLPCPFCGGEANRSSLFQICYCSNSHCFLYGSAIPITKWNTRHVPPMEISMLSEKDLRVLIGKHTEQHNLERADDPTAYELNEDNFIKELLAKFPTAKPLKEEHPDPCFIEKSHMQSVSMDENDKPVKEELDEKELSNALFDFAWNWIKCSTSNQSLVKELADKKAEELLSKFAVTNKPEVTSGDLIEEFNKNRHEDFHKNNPAFSHVPSVEEIQEIFNTRAKVKVISGMFILNSNYLAKAVRALWEGNA